MKKFRNYAVGVCFVLILIVFGLFTIFKEPQLISFDENRQMSTFEQPTVETITNGKFQKNVDSSFSDQIILREYFMKVLTKINNGLKFIVNFNIPADSLRLISLENGIFKVGINGDRLVEFPFIQLNDYDRMIQARIGNYNDLANKYEDTKFYIYQVTNAKDTDWFDEENEFLSGGKHYVSSFISQLNPSIKFSQLKVEDWESYKEISYKTDHHWNVFGAYQGYGELLELIRNDFIKIGTQKEPSEMYCSDLKFYGSYAKQIKFNIPSDGYDSICDFKYDLAPYTVHVNDELVSEYGDRIGYESGKFSTDKAANHYREWFGADTAKVEYDFGDNTGLNALIISDSYSNAIKPVLSSHFDKTTFIDPRHYAGVYNDFFNFKKFMEENDIDVVLFLGGWFTTMMEESYIITYY